MRAADRDRRPKAPKYSEPVNRVLVLIEQLTDTIDSLTPAKQKELMGACERLYNSANHDHDFEAPEMHPLPTMHDAELAIHIWMMVQTPERRRKDVPYDACGMPDWGNVG